MQCIACKSEIPNEATVCPKCSRFQSAWKNWVIFVGASAGLITLVVSGAIYIAGSVVNLVKTLSWEDRVKVVTFDYDVKAVFLNTGDGPIFLSHIDIKSDRTFEASVSIHKHVKPQDFADVVFQERKSSYDKWRGTGGAFVVSDVSDDRWNEIRKLDLRKHECFRHGYLHPDSPSFQLFARYPGHKLRTFGAKAQLHFYSTKTGVLASTEFPLKGVVYQRNTATCSAKPGGSSN